MSLDQNGTFEGTPGRLKLRRLFVVLLALVFLFLDADEHFREQITFQVLPRVAIFSDAHAAV